MIDETALNSKATLGVIHRGSSGRVAAGRVVFSPARFFRFHDDAEEITILSLLADHLLALPNLAFFGDQPLLNALLAVRPELAKGTRTITAPAELPEGISTVFITAVDAVSRLRLRQALPAGLTVLDVGILAEIATADLPARAWTPISRNIYPIFLPEIRFEPNLDLLLLDCPARNLALMPNGLGYVHNALKRTSVRFQTFDLDIVTYHRFHITRLFDEAGEVVLPSGRKMPIDPWQAEHYDLWPAEDVIAYFSPIIDEAAAAVIAARPRALGLSVHQCNEAFSRALVNKVKAALPDLQIIVGGFSCYNPEIGRRVFPECDYMAIGEAELTIGALVEDLAQGHRPKHLPGVLSRYDDPDHVYVPGPMPQNLDRIEFPKYEWFDLGVYRNFDGYQLTPIIASRGCRWSRCTFCAERFFWRIRSATAFVDELEWLVGQGCTLFMFNESDLNGMPEKLLEICDEIIRRDLHVKLTGQLRIHKKSDRAFFQKLRSAGFVSLRFGVDAFSANTMRLQKKGYTPDIVTRNLRDCSEAGIFTEVNWVVGTPGETWEDVNEGIQLILANRRHIGRLANINPLIFVNGSVYWLDPDSHNIRFRKPRDVLYAENWRALPADQWYSEHPYIDHETRKQYFDHIVVSLHDAGFPVGPWAQRIIDDVKMARDRHRAGGSDAALVTPAQPAPVATVPAGVKPSAGGSKKPVMVHFKGYWYAIDPEHSSARAWLAGASGRWTWDRLRKGLKALVRAGIRRFRSPTAGWLRLPRDVSGAAITVVSAVSARAEAELLRTIGNYNIVRFDGAHYGVPHGVSVDWSSGDAETTPEIVRGAGLNDVVGQIKRSLGLSVTRADSVIGDICPADTGTRAASVVVGTLSDYTILSCEGWYYGIPKHHGEIDLTEQDVLELAGVIRDLSRDVVEGEILERAGATASC